MQITLISDEEIEIDDYYRPIIEILDAFQFGVTDFILKPQYYRRDKELYASLFLYDATVKPLSNGYTRYGPDFTVAISENNVRVLVDFVTLANQCSTKEFKKEIKKITPDVTLNHNFLRVDITIPIDKTDELIDVLNFLDDNLRD